MDTRHRNILLEYIPEKSLETVTAWLDEYPVALTISRKRNSKMGDYRPPAKNACHRISVNGDLHPYAFLVTLVHELAHLVIWEKYKRRARPHGEQWKSQFRAMLQRLWDKQIFEDGVSDIVSDFSSGKISYRMFNLRFEKLIHLMTPGAVESLLGDLPPDAVFSLHNGRRFIKKEKVRTRFRCQDMRNGRIYLISPLAKVHPE
jgi:SprT protein